ncbi:hypothetical protein PV797_10415 [Clostridiaceae bacterium M8S5]|nr:hypothetical protein PV797_10415 [Clostridiaceae bacterium M8S5]
MNPNKFKKVLLFIVVILTISFIITTYYLKKQNNSLKRSIGFSYMCMYTKIPSSLQWISQIMLTVMIVSLILKRTLEYSIKASSLLTSIYSSLSVYFYKLGLDLYELSKLDNKSDKNGVSYKKSVEYLNNTNHNITKLKSIFQTVKTENKKDPLKWYDYKNDYNSTLSKKILDILNDREN